MPLTRTIDLGTNKNGTKNREYCKFCFKDGKFFDDGISLEEKIEKNVKIGMRMGLPEEMARSIAIKTIPPLKRWRNNDK